jgi:hypothetical protein
MKLMPDKNSICQICKKELIPLNQWSSVMYDSQIDGWVHRDCFLNETTG